MLYHGLNGFNGFYDIINLWVKRRWLIFPKWVGAYGQVFVDFKI